MEILERSYIHKITSTCQEDLLFGRWITLDAILKVFPKLIGAKISVERIGESEESRDIYQMTAGTGPKKILIWSQMHGNESTGTKALFDFFSFLNETDDRTTQQILSECTIKAIPILNPDGAQYYTRVNANNVDLNRDAVDGIAVESQLLRSTLESFNPDFCFNLHDQRTIFGVEGTTNPATLSFLAPSEEETREITDGRKRTMNIIVAMNSLLQQIIPNHIGRYTDKFYPTATGDNFQKLGFPTILIESGHYPNDYEREKVREFTFMSLLQGIYHIATANNHENYDDYFTIPNNQENFRDLLYEYPDKPDEAFQFLEILDNNKVVFTPEKVYEDPSGLLFHEKIVIKS
ncbi:MAG: DUF2817 domain-containing protein [Flavobacteriaceae bacterium]